ncbi:MAG: cell division protein ZapA [Muribaculaceae bacterium]|nr:cell division protein ZapA [Muribaculaceae bacterium]
MTDKLNITIRIAGQKPMTLSIDREYEETARNAEYQVNRLFGLWSERFRDKSPMEVMSMVAYRFAELFYTQNAAAVATEQLLDDFERELDRILVDTARS